MKKEPFVFTALQKASREKGRSKYFLLFLALSFVFWFISKFSRNYTEVVTLELVLQKLPSEVIPLLTSPLKIDATLNASGFQFLYYTLVNDQLKVDMTAAQFLDGKVELPLGAQFQSLQEQLIGETKIINYFPAIVEFDYQQQYTKRIPLVIPDLSLEVGYSAVSVHISPDSIDLVGPKNAVDQINSITPSFEQNELIKESFSTSVSLPELPQWVGSLQETVQLDVQVDRFSEKRFIVPVTLRNVPFGKVYKLYPEKVEVLLSAPLSSLKDIEATDIIVGVDFLEVNQSQMKKLPIQVFTAPEGVKTLRWFPKEIEYLIREE